MHIGGVTFVAIGVTIGITWTLVLPLSKADVVIQCMDAETRERVRSIMHDGIDQALKNHAVNIFGVWQKDPHDQPRRAVTGMSNAVNAYVGSRAALKRWAPLLCKGDEPK
jgi:hypothetical protein